jgi:hypothetical protein
VEVVVEVDKEEDKEEDKDVVRDVVVAWGAEPDRAGNVSVRPAAPPLHTGPGYRVRR